MAQELAQQVPQGLWPNGVRSSVALAFDVDGPTGAAMLDGSIWRNPSLFMLGAYGPWRALGYLLDMLREYRMPATFFVPGWVLETWPAQIRSIVERGHEIGYHGYQHEAFWQLGRERQQAVMAQSLALFQRHLGHCVSAATRRWPTKPPSPAGPEQVIPFPKHRCTLPASLAVHWHCLRSAFAFTNDLEMGSGHGGAPGPKRSARRPKDGRWPARRWQAPA
ncbi:hypothetical protein D5047_10360 [Verminephrobacter eiseniae]|nr:hypothetical protein [Verminephrobacter eiseniae]